jgi:oligopeptide/dipeptide ABC transporter ATP-binding protein
MLLLKLRTCVGARKVRVRGIIAEPLEIHTNLSRAQIRERVAEVLKLVGLQPDVADLFPHEFSGGQCQRIALARALVTDTRLVVLDKPVSALDVSIRAQIMNQLEHLQDTLGVSYLFIGHDLAGVAHIGHRIAVMYLGQLIELADAIELCRHPLHPYTQALLVAALPAHPDAPQERIAISGEVPSALAPPSGCRFHTRCPRAMPRATFIREVPLPIDPPIGSPMSSAASGRIDSTCSGSGSDTGRFIASPELPSLQLAGSCRSDLDFEPDLDHLRRWYAEVRGGQVGVEMHRGEQ